MSQTKFELYLRQNDTEGIHYMLTHLHLSLDFFPWNEMKWGRYHESPLSVAIRAALQYNQYDMNIITMLLVNGANPNYGYEEEVNGVTHQIDNFKPDIYQESTAHFNKRLNSLLLHYGGQPKSILNDNIDDMSRSSINVYTRLWVNRNTYPSRHQVEQLFEVLYRKQFVQVPLHELVRLLQSAWVTVSAIPQTGVLLEYILHYLVEEHEYNPYKGLQYCKDQLVMARSMSASAQFDAIKAVVMTLS